MSHDGQTITLPPGVTNDCGYVTHAWPDGTAVVECPDGRWYAAGCDELQLGYPNGTWRYFPDDQSAARALAALNVGPGAKKAEPEGPRHAFPGRSSLTFLGSRNGSDLYLDPADDRLVRVYAAGCAEHCSAAIAGDAPRFADALALARERGLIPEPAPKLPSGYDPKWIPADYEYRGEVRPPKTGEWYLHEGLKGPSRATWDFTNRFPILAPKAKPAEPPTPKPPQYKLVELPTYTVPNPALDAFAAETMGKIARTLPPAYLMNWTYKDHWTNPKETPMPETTPTPQGRPLTKEEFERLVLLRDRFTINEAPKAALNAYARWLHLQVDPSATFDEPAPTPPPVPAAPAAYVQTLQPIPGVFARVLGAAGIALLTGLATLAGVAGGGMLLLHHFAR